ADGLHARVQLLSRRRCRRAGIPTPGVVGTPVARAAPLRRADAGVGAGPGEARAGARPARGEARRRAVLTELLVKPVIIVVTFNSERFLDELFATLRAHTDWTTTRVVIVDNASADGTRAALERQAASFPELELLPQSANLGFTGGNNVGLARAR